MALRKIRVIAGPNKRHTLRCVQACIHHNIVHSTREPESRMKIPNKPKHHRGRVKFKGSRGSAVAADRCSLSHARGSLLTAISENKYPRKWKNRRARAPCARGDYDIALQCSVLLARALVSFRSYSSAQKYIHFSSGTGFLSDEKSFAPICLFFSSAT